MWRLKQTKNTDDRILLYCLHITAPTILFNGWILPGETKAIKTNTGRKRGELKRSLNLKIGVTALRNHHQHSRHDRLILKL